MIIFLLLLHLIVFSIFDLYFKIDYSLKIKKQYIIFIIIIYQFALTSKIISIKCVYIFFLIHNYIILYKSDFFFLKYL